MRVTACAYNDEREVSLDRRFMILSGEVEMIKGIMHARTRHSLLDDEDRKVCLSRLLDRTIIPFMNDYLLMLKLKEPFGRNDSELDQCTGHPCETSAVLCDVCSLQN